MKTMLLLSVLSLTVRLFAAENPKVCRPVVLKCEHIVNPIGIDIQNPRLTWQLDDDRRGAKQQGYQIFVGTDSASVASNQGTRWDTGKQSGEDMIIAYKGKTLKPNTPYFWKVNIWDKDGKVRSSAIARFETGMMGNDTWKAAWISDHNDVAHREAPYFRKEFEIKKTLKYARAYIAAGGLYELSLNGGKVGDHQLDPMYTRYDRRTLYVTHDISSELKIGKNAVGVILGNGWYNHQPLAVWDFHNAPWRARPTFCLEIHLIYTDGSKEIICSERDWKTSSGPIIYNNIYTGEHYDARREQIGWDKPGFDDKKWHGVRYRSAPSTNIVAQQTVPIRLVKIYKPKSVIKFDDKTWLFDMGQNMSGITKIKLSGKSGTTVRIAHGERLGKDGRLDLSNIDVYYRGDKQAEPFQTDILILSGKKQDEFMPKFNYKGFRYVEVTSSEAIALQDTSITAYFMHSDVAPTGDIKTSSALVNKLWRVTNNAYLSNLMGYPTDCPQREKNGWTGYGHLAIETALYNFDGITVYEKWLADHRDEQQPNGVLPDIIPTGGWGYGTANGLDWTSTIAIIPWQVYLFYGDSRLLNDCYENIRRYVDYVDMISPDGLTTFGRGDWVPVKSSSNLELTSSVYFYTDARILSAAAKLFGKESDYKKYSALTTKIKDAINAKFLNRESGIYATGTQTELSVPIYWDVVPEDMRAKVAANLNKKVAENNFHLDVGVLGAKALLNALCETGHTETAYKVATQDKYPSWGWWVVNGATTLLENWDLNAERDISDNHMMFGEIGGWFFKSVGGILPDPDYPGFKHIMLRPIFPEELHEATVKHKSPFGEIVSSWKKKGQHIEYRVTVPPNSRATFYPPKNTDQSGPAELLAGKHILKFRIVEK